MAEFALGLTKIAVEGTLIRVKSAIEEEKKLRVRVEDDLVFITGEFQMLQSFLNAANSGERASKNHVVRTWVRQLRELAFDVEDCIEFVVHLDKASPWDWVWRLTSSLICASRPPLPLDEAVTEIKRLKARVEDVSQRNTRYNLFGTSGDSSEHQYQLLMRPSPAGHTSTSETFHDLREVWKSMGKLHNTTGDLKNLIDSQGTELKVISLWGNPQNDLVGELGWMTIVKKAYDDPEICREFKNRAWVKLSTHHPFSPVEFLNKLLTHFTTSYNQHHHHDDITELVLQVSQHRYLVVLEQELCGVADWDAIRMCLWDGKKGSRIIVSTKQLGIALACTGDPYQVSELKRFSHDRYLYAFSPKGSDQLDHCGQADGGVNTRANGKYELGKLVGRKKEILFFDATPGETFSVWGIAGVGKSAIVRERFYGMKQKVYAYRPHYMYGWVDVPHPFNLTDLSRTLLLDLYSDDVSGKETALVGMMEGQDPIHGCCKILHENKCLLVIDGLRSTHDWDLIKATLLSQPNYCTTIVLTREESIATHCTTEEHILNVKGLEADVALDLFTKITFCGSQPKFSSKGEKISKLIMSKCGGLPEVIVAIGKSASESINLGESDCLELINKEFMAILENPTPLTSHLRGSRGLFSWMQSYFDACSDELKPCIFYMSVFPADQSIRRRRLLRRWIAEGYSSAGGGTAEEKGVKLLSELMKLSILYPEQQTSSVTKSYMVNGFFREYIKSRPMEDNLVFELEGSCSPSSRLTRQHLTISSSWDRDVRVFNNIDLSRLRSLTVSGAWRSFLICDKMKLLRVLDLEGTSTSYGTASVKDDDLEMIGKQFTRLKFLSLRGCMSITRLPDSLGGMRQLETLDARHTSIVKLPHVVITKLHKLQYIRAGTTEARRLEAVAVLEAMPTSPQEDGHNGTLECCCKRSLSKANVGPWARAKAAASAVVQGASTGSWKKRAGDLEESCSWWLSKNKRRHLLVAANGGGVEVVPATAEGLGKMEHLHTLGMVNIAGGKGGLLLLKELKKLTQLHKLGLSGINHKNWRMLCNAISGHLPHLESLSLQLLLLEEDGNYDFACFNDISLPPKDLKSLKVLYTTTEGENAGGACIRPLWIQKVPNLKKFHHELTISSQEDIDLFFCFELPVDRSCLRIRPMQQQLSFVKQDGGSWVKPLGALRIDCRCISSMVSFGGLVELHVEALNIHCCSSCGGSSCLQVVGLRYLPRLNQVSVTGPCSDGFKEDLRKQLDEHENKSHLKLLFTSDQQ